MFIGHKKNNEIERYLEVAIFWTNLHVSESTSRGEAWNRNLQQNWRKAILWHQDEATITALGQQLASDIGSVSF